MGSVNCIAPAASRTMKKKSYTEKKKKKCILHRNVQGGTCDSLQGNLRTLSTFSISCHLSGLELCSSFLQESLGGSDSFLGWGRRGLAP